MSKEAPKSRFQRFREMIAGNTANQETVYKEDTLSGYGVKVVSDGKLEARKAEYMAGMDYFAEENNNLDSTLSEDVNHLMDRLTVINSLVLRIGGVYATAGSDPRFAKLMRGWDKLYYNAVSKGNRVRDFWITDPKEKRGDDSMNSINVRNYRQYLNHLVFPDAQDVLNYCFRREDVRERGVVLIQSMMPMQQMGSGGETITGSGGRTSEDIMRHPRGGPYPVRSKSEIKEKER